MEQQLQSPMTVPNNELVSTIPFAKDSSSSVMFLRVNTSEDSDLAFNFAISSVLCSGVNFFEGTEFFRIAYNFLLSSASL